MKTMKTMSVRGKVDIPDVIIDTEDVISKYVRNKKIL